VFRLCDVRLLWVASTSLWFLIFVFILCSLPSYTKPGRCLLFRLDSGLNLVLGSFIVKYFLQVIFSGPFFLCKWRPLLFLFPISKFTLLRVVLIRLSFLCCLCSRLFLSQGLWPPLAQFLFNFNLPALTHVMTVIFLSLLARYVWLIQ